MFFLVHAVLAGHLVVTGAHTQVAADSRAACKEDYQTFCAGTQPGGGRIKACLQQNKANLSAACRAALSGTPAKS